MCGGYATLDPHTCVVTILPELSQFEVSCTYWLFAGRLPALVVSWGVCHSFPPNSPTVRVQSAWNGDVRV